MPIGLYQLRSLAPDLWDLLCRRLLEHVAVAVTATSSALYAVGPSESVASRSSCLPLHELCAPLDRLEYSGQCQSDYDCDRRVGGLSIYLSSGRGVSQETACVTSLFDAADFDCLCDLVGICSELYEEFCFARIALRLPLHRARPRASSAVLVPCPCRALFRGLCRDHLWDVDEPSMLPAQH